MLTAVGRQRLLILCVVAAVAVVAIVIAYSATQKEIGITVEKSEPYWVVTNTSSDDLRVDKVSFDASWSAPLTRARPATMPAESLPRPVILHKGESCFVLNATPTFTYESTVNFLEIYTDRGQFRYMVAEKKFN